LRWRCPSRRDRGLIAETGKAGSSAVGEMNALQHVIEQLTHFA
jgi:hypothetical protein